MPSTDLPAPRTGGSRRDPRIDLLRGFALVTIFIDHVPDNPLTWATMRNFGFADAAELFVILAGMSAMAAYGGAFEREGARSGLRRIAQRCLRIYLFQVGLLVATLAIVRQWRTVFGFQPEPLAGFFARPYTALMHALALHALPPELNILPLYVVLLTAFPLIYAGIRYARWPTLAVSIGMWAVANLDEDFNFTNWLDGRGWFFNPFAWQFLFTLGVLGAVALRHNGGALPRRGWLVALCWAYIVAGVVIAAPWVGWGLSDWQPIALEPSDKTNLAPERLIDILAVLYLALSSPWLRRVALSRWTSWLATCGRHSLEVFSFATVMALLFRLVFATFGSSTALEVAVNLGGVGAMVALAMALEWQRQRHARPKSALMPA